MLIKIPSKKFSFGEIRRRLEPKSFYVEFKTPPIVVIEVGAVDLPIAGLESIEHVAPTELDLIERYHSAVKRAGLV